MGELLARVVPLALGAAVSPTVLTMSVLLMCSPRRPVTRGAVFALGTLASLVVLSALGLTVLDRFGTHHPTATEHAVSDGVDVALGLVLLALALRTALRHRDPTVDATPKRPSDQGGLGTAFVLGVVLMATNVSTIVLYIPAMKDIGRAPVSETDQLLALLVVLAIVSLPATVPLALRIVAPGPSQRFLTRLDAAITRHQRTIVIAVEVLFGLYLLIKGI
jgi:hypothetical protein